MPNQAVYSNEITTLEKEAGFSFIDRAKLKKTLQEAWEKDKTPNKVEFLKEYQKIFDQTLQTWVKHEAKRAYNAHSAEKPDFQKCLWGTERALKMSAMALIPQLREDDATLKAMTFGSIAQNTLHNNIYAITKQYGLPSTAEQAQKERMQSVYKAYKAEWQDKRISEITALIFDKEALALVSEDDKVNYAIALHMYHDEMSKNGQLGEIEEVVFQDALLAWDKEIGYEKGQTLEEFVANRYYAKGREFSDDGYIDNAIDTVFEEYNKIPNPTQREMQAYKGYAIEESTKKKESEHTIEIEEIGDEGLEAVGDLFGIADLEYSLANDANLKERQFFKDEVESFNKRFDLTVSQEKMQTSIEQVTKLMLKASAEKQEFLKPENVVVIENGVEKVYPAKEYFKDIINEAEETRKQTLKEVEEEKKKQETRIQKETEDLLNKIEAQKAFIKKDELEVMQQSAIKSMGAKVKDVEAASKKSIAQAEALYQEKMSTTQGGFVVEKENGVTKRHKTSEYYETHETKKEKEAYSEHQKMFKKLFKDACGKIKEQAYIDGRVADIARIATEVEHFFRKGMFMANVYDGEEPECIAKTAFGGFTVEQLSTMAAEGDEKDAWSLDQSSQAAWNIQSKKAKDIHKGWSDLEREGKTKNLSLKIVGQIAQQRNDFLNKKITSKDLLDYAIAAEARFQSHYQTRWQKFRHLPSYINEKNIIETCRQTLGLSKDVPLRIAMQREYQRLSKAMSKEQIFEKLQKPVNEKLSFKETKEKLVAEHNKVKESITKAKQAELDQLKQSDREPISIPALDERKVILNQQPRVQPIIRPIELGKKLAISQN